MNKIIGGLLGSKMIRNALLRAALSKLENVGINPKEAIDIFNDAQKKTEDYIPDLTLDEVAALTEYVLSQSGKTNRIVALVGVVFAAVVSFLGGGTFMPTGTPATVAPVLTHQQQIEVNDFIQSFCSTAPEKACFVTKITPTADGKLKVTYDDAGTPTSMTYQLN